MTSPPICAAGGLLWCVRPVLGCPRQAWTPPWCCSSRSSRTPPPAERTGALVPAAPTGSPPARTRRRSSTRSAGSRSTTTGCLRRRHPAGGRCAATWPRLLLRSPAGTGGRARPRGVQQRDPSPVPARDRGAFAEEPSGRGVRRDAGLLRPDADRASLATTAAHGQAAGDRVALEAKRLSARPTLRWWPRSPPGSGSPADQLGRFFARIVGASPGQFRGDQGHEAGDPA